MVDARASPPKAGVELADIVRRFAAEYTSQYGSLMMPSQKQALSDIAACCTAELGGRLYRCDDCHDTFWHYHCCRKPCAMRCHPRVLAESFLKQQIDADLIEALAHLLPDRWLAAHGDCRLAVNRPTGIPVGME